MDVEVNAVLASLGRVTNRFGWVQDGCDPEKADEIVNTLAIKTPRVTQRRIVVQYPKRQVGNKMYGGEASHLPLKINTSGVIPPIFASSLLLLPGDHRLVPEPGRRTRHRPVAADLPGARHAALPAGLYRLDEILPVLLKHGGYLSDRLVRRDSPKRAAPQ